MELLYFSVGGLLLFALVIRMMGRGCKKAIPQPGSDEPCKCPREDARQD